MTTSEVQVPVPDVRPEPDTRLDQLAAEYAALAPLAKEYNDRLNEIKDGIKAELANAAPGATKVLLTSSYLEKPLQLSARSEWRLDSKRLKAEHPATWVEYAKQTTSWRLESAR
jgi:hypothetical protein